MADVLNKNVGAGLSVKELGLLGLSKVATERISQRFIGNSSARSGLIKIGAGLVVALAVKNRAVRFASAGAVLDGVEDLIEVGTNRVSGNAGVNLV